MKYVIIGNSTAAIGCVEGIRSVDTDGAITIISNENHHTYSRPLISYLLWGKTDEERMKYRPDSFYVDNGCETIFGENVIKIEPDKKSVLLESGKSVEYDKLMVATGSRPFIPPMEGLENVKNKFTFMSLDDAHALGSTLSSDARVLIVGAGLIGLKCAEGICDKVSHITVVDLADRILPSILDEEGSKLVQKHIEEKNVSFILSDSVKKFSPDSAFLASGKTVGFDILVIAVGVRPNTGIVSEAGGNVGRGIITNEFMETSIKDVYAAGDCCESFDIASSQNKILAILPNAYMQGECGGINMAGGSKPFEKAIAMNAIGFFGLHIITAGSYDGDVYTMRGENSYKKLVTKDNRLVGYIMIGDVMRAGIYTSLIREKTPLDTIDFELIKQKPQLMAFTRGVRAQKLGTKR